MAKRKIHTVTLEIKFNEKPDTKRLIIGECVGRITKLKKEQDFWIASVLFTGESIIELMVKLDDRIISTEVH